MLCINLCNPLIQLRFNVHDYNYRLVCFKKGPGLRKELPLKHTSVARIHFDNGKCINWHFIDSSTREITLFEYHLKRIPGDQFMNIDNNTTTTVLVCNNNVTLGDRVWLLCHSVQKANQKEDACMYRNICCFIKSNQKDNKIY